MALCVLLLLLVIAATATTVSAIDHIVGANKGWTPGVNYTLWSNNQTFHADDFISFRYQKTEHNVLQVNKMGYDSCTIEGALGNWSSGKDFIKLDRSKRYYFICGIGGCSNGMKVSVLVHPLSQSPPPRSAVSAVHSSEKSAAPVTVGGLDSLVLVGFMVFVCCWI
ncbi:hypothetical protein K7X08_013492 [Anisodus acutangulus]|uniref:Phytocyanin domain-containing protein n=1 Tax=Anisodus acutangulus TaxID=402998 RepID=A0A9Q1LN10_9SOLA|nr:hypothetical protein K7X08_013492 [Anisodus acutangulus]